MDNDQPDHLTDHILFRNDVTAAFSMEVFVSCQGRRMRIMGSLGAMTGDPESFTVTSFKTGKRRVWSMKNDVYGGGYHPMVRDRLQTVGQQQPAGR